jgi:hypothetical protein
MIESIDRHCERSEAIQRSRRLLLNVATFANAIQGLRSRTGAAISFDVTIFGLLRSARNDGGSIPPKLIAL